MFNKLIVLCSLFSGVASASEVCMLVLASKSNEFFFTNPKVLGEFSCNGVIEDISAKIEHLQLKTADVKPDPMIAGPNLTKVATWIVSEKSYKLINCVPDTRAGGSCTFLKE